MTRLLTLTTALAMAAASVAEAQPSDTTHISHDPLFTSKDAWIAGAFVVGTAALYPADRYFARKLQSTGNQENKFLRNAASDFPLHGNARGPMIIGVSMYGVGRIAKVDRMADLGLHGTEALLISQGIVSIAKGLAGRSRPEAGHHRTRAASSSPAASSTTMRIDRSPQGTRLRDSRRPRR
jgi:hypothetical protein